MIPVEHASSCDLSRNVLAYHQMHAPNAPPVLSMLFALERLADTYQRETSVVRAVLPAVVGLDTRAYATIAVGFAEGEGAALVERLGIDIQKVRAGRLLIDDGRVDLRLRHVGN